MDLFLGDFAGIVKKYFVVGCLIFYISIANACMMTSISFVDKTDSYSSVSWPQSELWSGNNSCMATGMDIQSLPNSALRQVPKATWRRTTTLQDNTKIVVEMAIKTQTFANGIDILWRYKTELSVKCRMGCGDGNRNGSKTYSAKLKWTGSVTGNWKNISWWIVFFFFFFIVWIFLILIWWPGFIL